MARIITIGSVSKDIFFPTSEGIAINTPEDLLSQKKLAFEFGAKYHIDERFESLGGCSVNVASGLAKLGESVSVYTTIGDDMTGRWIYSQLEKSGIGLEYLSAKGGCKSDLSAIIVDQGKEDRIIFSNQVANQKLVIDAQRLSDSGVEWIFIGDLSGNWQSNLDAVVAVAKEKNIHLAFNPRQKTIHEDVEKIKEVISFCDLLFVNKDEAMEILMPANSDLVSDDETILISELRKIGVKNVVLTDGKRGAWATGNDEIFHVESLLVETVDTTGAGDAFASGFFAARLKNGDVQQCLQWGIANSSSSVTKYGGQDGLLTQEQVIVMASQIDVKKLG